MTTLVLLLALLPNAHAADACKSDAAALCPKAAAGPERVRCLEENAAKLSAACREHLDEMREAGEAFRSDCKADIGGACLNLQGRALLECLEAQGDKLSRPCADKLASIKEAKRAKRERIPAACKDEAQKACADAAAGGILACLRARADLSKACRESLK